MRVVSVVPSVTETLAAWGIEPIACTRYCERPDLVHIGGTKNPDINAIVDLAPDLVVMDIEENRRDDAEALTAAGCEILALHVDSIEGLPAQLARLAEAVGVPAPECTMTARPSTGLRALVPIWRRPWMTVGAATYGSSLLGFLGVENVAATASVPYPEFTIDEMATARPDVVLVPSEPYEFTDAHLAELAVIAPTVRIDGQDLFWWGARTPDALRRLGQVVDDLVRR